MKAKDYAVPFGPWWPSAKAHYPDVYRSGLWEL